MPPILFAAVSILAITAFMRFVWKYSPLKICPICAGTAGTWLLILAGMRLGILESGIWWPVAGILMGGSVVGIAYQSERHLKESRTPLFWKALFVPTGFVIVWAIVTWNGGLFLATGGILLFELWYFFVSWRHVRSSSTKVEKLEKEMEECC